MKQTLDPNRGMRCGSQLAFLKGYGDGIHQMLRLGNFAFDYQENEQTCEQIKQRSLRCSKND